MTSKQNDIERVARAYVEAESRYRVEGTTDSEYGEPPYRAPWYLIDTSTQEPEVNWPGDLVAEYDSGQEAWNHRSRLIARAAYLAVLDCLEEPSEAMVTHGTSAISQHYSMDEFEAAWKVGVAVKRKEIEDA